MKKKQTSFAKFSDVARSQRKGPTRVYAEGLSSHKRRVKKVKKSLGMLGGCNLI